MLQGDEAQPLEREEAVPVKGGAAAQEPPPPPKDDGILYPAQDLEHLIQTTIPMDEIVYAFGYGSGVFSQQQQHHQQQQQQQQDDEIEEQEQKPKPFCNPDINAKTISTSRDNHNHHHHNHKMVDLILVVTDSLRFHQQNYERNPSHYWTPPRWMVQPHASLFMMGMNQPVQPQERIRGATHKGGGDDRFHLAWWFTQWQRETTARMDKEDAGGDSRGTKYTMNGCWRTRILGRNPGVYFNLATAPRNHKNEQNNSSIGLAPAMKYGIVQVEDLLEDLRDWKYFYLAGRMHKPILPLLLHPGGGDLPRQGQPEQPPLSRSMHHDKDTAASATCSRTRIEQYQQDNLTAALSASLLLLSSSNRPTQQELSCFSEWDLYRTITELSYRGDYRMQMGAEDPHKITRLVQSSGQSDRFRWLYQPILNQLIQQGLPLEQISSNETYQTDSSHSATIKSWAWTRNDHGHDLLWSQLPTWLQQGRPSSRVLVPRSTTTAATVTTTTTRTNPIHHTWNSADGNWLSRQIAARVASSARYQSLKGIVTAGPTKAWQYAARKLSKGVIGKTILSTLSLFRRRYHG
ncbi:hypothetical protein ACA910_022692 [Epithemia clementina (nom. ined.)]